MYKLTDDFYVYIEIWQYHPPRSRRNRSSDSSEMEALMETTSPIKDFRWFWLGTAVEPKNTLFQLGESSRAINHMPCML